MALTFVTLATTTLASTSTAIEFTSISADYTDLMVNFSLRSSEANSFTDQGFRVTFNNSTTGYDNILLYGNSTTPGALNNSNQAALQWMYGTATSSTTSTFSSGYIYIPNYTTSNKKGTTSDSVTLTNHNAALYVTALTAGRWDNTAAITSIKLATSTGHWVEHSSATLYGIKNTV